MQLSLHADFALRVLIYLGTHRNRLVTTQEISSAYCISKHHLVRVVQTLAEQGYVDVHAGRSGGVILARKPDQIRLGDVVRSAEPNMRLVECFDRETNTCPIASVCALKGMLNEAMNAFLASLNQYTIADVLQSSGQRKLAGVFAKFAEWSG
jgi:Rrf2 family nitric oxide-sensitive transcriptional repressor